MSLVDAARRTPPFVRVPLRFVWRLAVRLVPRPSPRPPIEDPERVRRLSQTPADESFITGNGIAARCRFVLNYDVLKVNEDVHDNWWFCKADFLEYFFAEIAPDEPFVLFSHNSDRPIAGRRCRRWLGRPKLVAWFAENADLEHPKLHALPLGIANPRWAHGDQQALKAAMNARIAKTRIFDATFDVRTNPAVREYCIEQTGITPDARLPFRDYLERLASARFCLCPRGNGIDAHRMWEALYLRAVPVVTRSLLTEQHPDLPMLVLGDWSEFRTIDFTPELYDRIWGDWSPDAIRLDRYFDRVLARIEASTAS